MALTAQQEEWVRLSERIDEIHTVAPAYPAGSDENNRLWSELRACRRRIAELVKEGVEYPDAS